MSRSAWGVFGLAVVAALAILLGVTRCEGTPPRIAAPERVMVGRQGQTLVFEVADDGAGVREVSSLLVHTGGEAPLDDRLFPGRWLPFGDPPPPQRIEIAVDPAALGLREGEAKLRVTARDHSWRSWLAGNQVSVEIPLEIDFRAPHLSLEPGTTHERRGGSGVVVYSVSEATARDGVQVGERFFPGVKPSGSSGVPGAGGDRSPGARVALFALPIDAPGAKPVVIAVDGAGNEAKASPQFDIAERRVPDTMIPLSPRFLEEKVGELAAAVGVDASDRVEAFQEINTRVRQENEKRIREVIAESAPEPLFSGPFEQMANSKVTSPFAEHRSYIVDGKKVSESIHYGYDLASLAGSPITASNSGRVLFAGELGIYGNCVILDHGLGLASLYGHLSSIDVQVGDRVERGQRLGLSGQTGLAGGDHLHFAMLLHGAYVDPVEWWDGKWVREHFEEKLAAAQR